MSRSKTRPNQLVNILLNVLIPTIIMTNFSTDQYLGPINALIIALLFPLTYGLYEFFYQQKLNFFSGLGFTSVFLTGIIGVLKLNPGWIAFKESTIPLLIGFAIVISQRTKYPLIRTFLKQIINLKKIDAAFTRAKRAGEFETQLTKITYILGFAYLISAILNYLLAVAIVKSPPGTTAYTQEIGKMTALSYPVIALPMMLIITFALFTLIRSIKAHTHLKLDDVLYQ